MCSQTGPSHEVDAWKGTDEPKATAVSVKEDNMEPQPHPDDFGAGLGTAGVVVAGAGREVASTGEWWAVSSLVISVAALR